MTNLPKVKMGIVSVSRDCFIATLSQSRRHAVCEAFKKDGGEMFECSITVENENDAMKALEELNNNGVNSLVLYLGNFGPETPETILAKKFNGPVMVVAAAEETGTNLVDGRGDAYCGMLNCSYNLALRNVKAYIPEKPVGTAEEISKMILGFIPIAASIIGLNGLKIISFGPRPTDFMACNAPIKPFYDLGVEVEENSELDLLVAFKKHENDPRIASVAADMAAELGDGNKMAGILNSLAQYELTLLDWAEEHKGSREFVAFANKCWPAFQTEFGFVPCYVNSRLTAMGIPVACEVDMYGALSEYIGLCITNAPVTLLDINNSVPTDLFNEDIKGKFDFYEKETFMGFHCGNTPICRLKKSEMKYQLIMKRNLEPNSEPNITRGTLEGDLKESNITFFRLQGNAGGKLLAYVAQGEILPVATRSFGAIGIFAIPQMDRFYRHVLIEKNFPHHGAVAFSHVGKTIFEVFKYLSISDISYNQPKSLPYPTENPFC